MSWTAPGRPPEGDSPPDSRRWLALSVCLVGGFMVLLDVSIVNVALRSIEAGLHTSSDQLQWVLSGYALTFGLLLVPAGRLGDARGRRTMFIVGLALFTAASVGCGVAQTGTWLVIARLIQGLAGGLLTPQISALIQQLFTGPERGKAFGLFGAAIGISTAVGPLLGGLLISAFGTTDGWRYVFFVNLPIGIVLIPVALRLLPGATDDQHGHRHDYDLVGVVLLGAGVTLLLLPFMQEQQWHSATKWLLLPAAAATVALFVTWEVRYRNRGREALVDLTLFTRRSFSYGTAMITVYFAGFTPLFFVVTLLLQLGYNYSALLAGAATVPFALGSGLAATVGGRVVHRFGRPLVLLGLVLVAVGYTGVVIATWAVPDRRIGWAILVPLLVGGIGSGLVIAPNQTLTLSDVPVRQAGTAGGLLQVGQRIGSAVGIAAVGSVFFARLSASHGRDYAGALQRSLLVAIGFLLTAVAFALLDTLVNRRRGQHRAPHAPLQNLTQNRA